MNTHAEAVAAYNDTLNESAGEVSVAGITWDAADVLRQLDPTAYRVGYSDFLDAYLTEHGYEEDDFDDKENMPD